MIVIWIFEIDLVQRNVHEYVPYYYEVNRCKGNRYF
jgi:hypothetical protein